MRLCCCCCACFYFCCCCYWNALKNTSNKCYSSLANQIAWCANIFVCLTKSKSFLYFAKLFTRILFAYFMYSFLYFYFDFHVFCCWIFSPFVTPLAYVSYLCTLLLSLGWFFHLSEPDTNLFVYGHVEGWRREVWAAYVGCQSVYTAVLKPPTVNVWKCFFLGTKCWWCGCTYRFVVSSRAKVTCHMRIVVGGDFVWFFSVVVVLHLSFFLIFRASAWGWRAKSCAKCVFAMDIWICN